MSGLGAAWLAHAGAATIGLAATGLVLGVALRLLRARPVAAYRLASAVLVGALALPLVQAAAARLELGDTLRALASEVLPERGPGLGLEPDAELGSERGDVARAIPLATEVAGLRGSEAPAASAPAAPEGFEGLETFKSFEPFATFSPFSPLSIAPWLLLGAGIDDAPASTALTDSEPGARADVEGGVAWNAQLARWAPWLAGLHAAGLAWCLGRSLMRLRRTRAALRRARAIEMREAPGIAALWSALRARSPLGSRIALRASDDVHGPACFGGARPAILLPREDVERDVPTVRDRERLRCVLVHELVHLERKDSRAMLAQEAFRALFWFHPAAWWLSRELDRLRELSCDWIAVRRAGSDDGRVVRYATALLDYAARGSRPRRAFAAHGSALVGRRGSSSQLRRRIDMLIALETRPPRRASRTALSLVVLALAGSWGAQAAAAAAWAPRTPASEPSSDPLSGWLSDPSSDPLSTTPSTLTSDPRSDPLSVTSPDAGSAPWSDPSSASASAPYAPFSQPSAQGAPFFPAAPVESRASAQAPTLGIAHEPAGEALAAHLGRSREHLLVVTQVVPGSLAERAGIERLDVLYEVDGEPISSAALARAKERLGAGGSLRLGLFRRGLMQVQQVGPFNEQALEQGRSVLRERRERQVGEEMRVTEEAARARVGTRVPAGRGDAPLARLREGDAAAQRELYERALDYYRNVDGERFRQDLGRAIELYEELERRGQLDERGRAHRERIQELLRPERTEAYVDEMRQRLEHMSPEQFAETFGALSELDPQMQRSIVARWLALAEERAARGEVRERSPEGGRDELLRALAEAERRLERQAQELEKLRQRLLELEGPR